VSRITTVWSSAGRHSPFAVVLAAGVALRAAVMLGFPPAIWFGGDSASYLSTALRMYPSTSRVSGYGVMLAILRPLHSFELVTAIQHLMGLAIAVMIYLLARRYGVPGWGAALASLPVLLDGYELQLEHEILPSVPFGFLVMAALTLTLWWRARRPAWATVTAGFLLAVAATFWPVGTALLLLFLLYLIVRRAGWRRIAATAAAAAVTLGAYLGWFGLRYHSLAFTYSDGIYLWSRTMSFANCKVIKPPAGELALCPHRPLAGRPSAGSFIWAPYSPLDRLPPPKFSPRNNALAMDFALRAIEAQPGSYAATVARDVGMSFTWNRPVYPSLDILQRYEFGYATRHWVPPTMTVAPGRTVASDQLAYGGVTSTRTVAPFAGWLTAYQQQVYLRGTLLAVIVVIGLAGIARSAAGGGLRRRDGWGGPGLLPWVTAAALLVVPVMTADFDLRYVLISVPAACLAAVLAFARAPEPPAAAGQPWPSLAEKGAPPVRPGPGTQQDRQSPAPAGPLPGRRENPAARDTLGNRQAGH
jgi:hypothetical protein